MLRWWSIALSEPAGKGTGDRGRYCSGVLLLSVETTPAIGRNAFVYNLFIPFNTQSSVELLARPARDSDRGSGYAERR